MRIRSKTLFSNSSPRTPEEVENKRVSYWLEKLFNQAKNKEKKDLGKQSITREAPTSVTSITEEIVLTPEEKGVEEAVISHAGKAEKNRQAVEDMVNNSNRILIKISSVFPLDFFPTTITLEETRLTITHRQLFSSQVHSVDLKNISNIFIDNSILFSQLTIVSNTFAENQIIVGRLWKKEAIFIRRMIEGLRMFIEKDIDTTDYNRQELIDKLRELSTTKIVL
ncbi:MAG: hypothetical protein ACHQT7_01305 [Candidatus Levyibacteriota bacterium]